MALLEVGRICIKKYGRDAGSKAVVTALDNGGFVRIVTAKRNRERRCNPQHLEFLPDKVDARDKEAVQRVLGIMPKVTHAGQGSQKAR